jgi:5-methylcytosine-specific restriction endonuclease McrA
MKCKFCSKESKNNGALTMHERSCKNNPNRLVGTFYGKSHTTEAKKKQAKSFLGKVPETLYDVSSRTLQKILKRMNAKCSNCGWDKTTCDIHHIVPRKKGGTDDHTNLTVLCPNCHRLAHENQLLEMINIETQYGDQWRKFYYSHN